MSIPNWARSAVTDVAISGSGAGAWDGSGPGGGWPQGEIEDYFLEYAPVGPMYTSLGTPQEPAFQLAGLQDQQDESTGLEFFDELVNIHCPDSVAAGDSVACELSGAPAQSIGLTVMTGAEGGEVATPVLVRPEATASLQHDRATVAVRLDSSAVQLTVERAEAGSVLAVFGNPADETAKRGSGLVEMVGGAMIVVE
jgi:hypothetical protein